MGLIIPGIRSDTCPIAYLEDAASIIAIATYDKSSIVMFDGAQTFSDVATDIEVKSLNHA